VSPPVACERQYRSRGPGLETHDPQVAGLGSHSGHYSGLEARHGGRMASKGGFALVRDSRSIDTTEPIHSRPLLSCSMASSLMHIVSNFQLPGFLTSSRDSAENGRRTLVHVIMWDEALFISADGRHSRIRAHPSLVLLALGIFKARKTLWPGQEGPSIELCQQLCNGGPIVYQSNAICRQPIR